MQTKRLFTVVAAMLLALSLLLTACNGLNWSDDGVNVKKVQLDRPQGLRIENGNLCWNPVEYASRYTVSIDGAEYYSDDFKYSLDGVRDGTHTFKVKANGDGVMYTSSSFSEDYTVELESGAVSTSNYYGQFDELTKNESFLGYGFDVINSAVFSDKYVKTSFRIFDTDGLMQQRLVKVDSKQSYVEEVKSESMSEFIDGWNVNANVNVSLGDKKVGGSSSLKSAFSGSVADAQSKYFHCISVNNQKFYIVMQSDMSTLRNIISKGFENDLYSDMEPAELFNHYGTHFITSAVMGGKINSYYLYSSKEEKVYQEMSEKVSYEIRYNSLKSKGSLEMGYMSYAHENNIYIKNTLDVLGGGDFGMLSDVDIGKNYADWEKSLNDHAALIGIKDSSSLVPIWDLIDASKDNRTYTWNYDGVEGSGSRSQQLQAYFAAYGIESYNSLMEAAALPTIVTPESISDVKVNNLTSDDDQFEAFAGTLNDISFTVNPANATGYTKTASIVGSYDWARINNDKGALSLEIDSNAPAGEMIDVVLSAGGVRKNIKVVVQKRYNVTFVSNGGTEVAPYRNVLHNHQIQEPATPKYSGYDFLGWYTDPAFAEGTLYQFGRQPVTSNLTLYAKWQPTVVTVLFVDENGDNLFTKTGEQIMPVTTNVANGYMAEQTAVPVKTGYTFVGWTLNDKDVDLQKHTFVPKNGVSTTYKVVAKWQLNAYTLTYIVDGEQFGETQTLDYGANIYVKKAQKEGYTFSGWTYNGGNVPDKMPASDVTLVGSFTINSYKLIYRIDGEDDVQIVPYGTEIVTKSVGKEGYTFGGWSYNGGAVPKTMPAADIVLDGEFTVNYYTLTYVVDGNVYGEKVTVKYGAALYLRKAEREGFTFGGWKYNNDIAPETMPASDITLVGEFVVNNYTVTYRVDGKLYKEDTFAYNETIVYATKPTQDGKEFVGWTWSKGALPTRMPAENILITGGFDTVEYLVSYYVGGELLTQKTVRLGNEIPNPQEEKKGYTFSGWTYKNTEDVGISIADGLMPAFDINAYGDYVINTYTLTMTVDDVNYGEVISLQYGATIELPQPVKEGYTFSGWTYNDGAVPATMPAENMIVKGYFEVNNYKVTYKIDGVILTEKTIPFGAKIAVDYQQKEGYTFSGWTCGGMDVPQTMPAHDIVLDGEYVANNYKITYVIDGKVCAEQEVAYGTNVELRKENKPGYTFGGWYIGGEKVTSETITVTGNVKTEGNFTLNTYKIVYELNGGEHMAVGKYPTNYTVELLPTIDNAVYATYPDYNRFVGWYLDEGLTVTYEDGKENLLSAPKDITLYAKWDLCTIYTSIDSTPGSLSGRVIVDWSEETEVNLLKHSGRSVTEALLNTVDIANTATEVIFIGRTNAVYVNMLIRLCNFVEGQGLKITFVNFNFTANESAAVKVDSAVAINLTVESSGNSSINSSYAGGTIFDLDGSKIVFVGDGDMTVTAGSGADATSDGTDGKAGGTAIVAQNVVVAMSKGKLTVYGGQGGKGKKGSDGAMGSTGSSLTSGGYGGTAGRGGNGGVGSKGGNGGAGGIAVSADIIVQSGRCEFVGGTGGIAGVGGQGGLGGTGGYTTRWGKGQGGTGGNGGVGGAGGIGGNGGAPVVGKLDVKDGACSVVGGQGAKGGNGGAGGNGGTGGRSKDQRGIGGTGGSGATGGNGGNAGKGYVVDSTDFTVSDNAALAVTNGTNGASGKGGTGGCGGNGGVGGGENGKSYTNVVAASGQDGN